MENASLKRDYSFPVSKPVCCGITMYAAGGVLGVRPDGKPGDLEHFWRCSICGNETVDLLSQESLRIEIK